MHSRLRLRLHLLSPVCALRPPLPARAFAPQAFKDMNSEAFTDAVYNYDQISKLDPWKTT